MGGDARALLFIERPLSSRVLLAAVSCTLAVLPFLVVRFPPITDLPQHAAQIRLALEALAGDDHHRVQWWMPCVLPYGLLALSWALVGPAHAGRLAFCLVTTLGVAATHVLAARRG